MKDGLYFEVCLCIHSFVGFCLAKGEKTLLDFIGRINQQALYKVNILGLPQLTLHVIIGRIKVLRMDDEGRCVIRCNYVKTNTIKKPPHAPFVVIIPRRFSNNPSDNYKIKHSTVHKSALSAARL